jgi:hypothetical protein
VSIDSTTKDGHDDTGTEHLMGSTTHFLFCVSSRENADHLGQVLRCICESDV